MAIFHSYVKLQEGNNRRFRDIARVFRPLFGRRLPCKPEFATPTQQAGCRDPVQRFFAPIMTEFLRLTAVLLRHALRTA